MQGNRKAPRSAVRSGLLTGVSTAAVSGAAGIAGAILSRKFGHGAMTDGFFAAYAIYVALAARGELAPGGGASRSRASARRRGARARARVVGDRAGGAACPRRSRSASRRRTRSPACSPTAPRRGRAPRELLPWLACAAAAQVYAGVAASALAALDDYGTAAFGYVAGAVAGVAAIAASRRSRRRRVRLGPGGQRRGLARHPARRAAPGAGRSGRRAAAPAAGCARSPRASSLPFALQGLYVIGYRFASGLGTGKPTTFSYAYLIASLLVAVTATSVALISSAPLARGELTPERSARHIVSASWASLALVAGAAGFFALAGERVARIVLGSSYGGSTGAELGRLVAYLAPWMVASIALSVAFPLLFVRGRAAWLPLLAAGRARRSTSSSSGRGRAWLGLAGIAAGMAVTTFAILAVLLLRARGAAGRPLRGLLARRAPPAGCRRSCCFGGARLLVGAVPAAAIGLVLYAGALALWRPPGLAAAWGYLRRLHDR